MTRTPLHRLVTDLLILPLLFGASCSNDNTEKPNLTLSVKKIVLASETGSTAVFDVKTNTNWTLTFNDKDFEVSPTHGGCGTTSVTVTAMTAAVTSTPRKPLLGTHRTGNYPH